MRILGYRIANDEPVTVAERDWLQHAYAIGGTGYGKTTWLESLMAADLSQRRGFCYLDKHGDSAKRIADGSPTRIEACRTALPIHRHPVSAHLAHGSGRGTPSRGGLSCAAHPCGAVLPAFVWRASSAR